MRPNSVPIFLILLGAPVVLVGQDASTATPSEGESRREELMRKREQKREEGPTLEELSGFEKVLLFLESGVKREYFQIRYKDFYPKFGAPQQGAGLGGGIRYYKKDIASSGLTAESMVVWSTRDYRVAELQFGRFTEFAPIVFLGHQKFHAPFEFTPETPWQIKRPKTFFYGDFKYHYYPQEDFFGLGPVSEIEDQTNYRIRRLSGEILAGYEFSQWFAAAIKTGYLDFDLGSGTDKRYYSIEEVFDDTTAPGIGRHDKFFRVSLGAFINYQDNPDNPHSGGIIGIFFTKAEQIDGKDFDFDYWAVDSRHYIPLGSEQRTLAFRLAASWAEAEGTEGRVPFYLMPTLGGTQTLRGFQPFRFRDANVLYGSAEYRWEPAPAVQFGLFYDIGKTYAVDAPVNLKGLEKSWGFGVRFKTAKHVVIRIDIGFSREGTRFNLRSGAAF